MLAELLALLTAEHGEGGTNYGELADRLAAHIKDIDTLEQRVRVHADEGYEIADRLAANSRDMTILKAWVEDCGKVRSTRLTSIIGAAQPEPQAPVAVTAPEEKKEPVDAALVD